MQISNGYSDNNMKMPNHKDKLVSNLKARARLGAFTLSELNSCENFNVNELFKHPNLNSEIKINKPKI